VHGSGGRQLEGSMSARCMTIGLLFAFALSGCPSSGGIKPFTTDGCSMFPEGTEKQKDLWLTCCINHDLDYWKGGTSEERLRADQELKACVAQTGEPEIARLMHAGVRVGGTPYVPTKFRWGYGWPWFRGYRELSDVEWEQVKQRLSRKERTDGP
jgi:hypothetical protein